MHQNRERVAFMEGEKMNNDEFKKWNEVNFGDLSEQEKRELILRIEQESKEYDNWHKKRTQENFLKEKNQKWLNHMTDYALKKLIYVL